MLKAAIPIGLVWLKKRRDAPLITLIDIITGMPKDTWRNGE